VGKASRGINSDYDFWFHQCMDQDVIGRCYDIVQFTKNNIGPQFFRTFQPEAGPVLFDFYYSGRYEF